MAQKDITEKKLETHNDVFADIMNNLVFDGEPVISASDLEDVHPADYYSAESVLIREQERDVAKVWKEKNTAVRIAYLGTENETAPEDDMPFRIIGYDGAAYRDQIRYEYDEDGNRVKVIERYPVATLVLYLGFKKKWDKAKSIYEVLGDNLDERLKKIVHDYPINLYEIAFLSREQIDRFKSDFWFLADYLYQMRTDGDYVPSEKQLRHVRAVLNMLEAVTGDTRFTEYVDELEQMKEGVTMCEVLDRVENKGVAKGEEREQRNRIEIMLRDGKTPQAIVDFCKYPMKLVQDVQRSLVPAK